MCKSYVYDITKGWLTAHTLRRVEQTREAEHLVFSLLFHYNIQLKCTLPSGISCVFSLKPTFSNRGHFLRLLLEGTAEPLLSDVCLSVCRLSFCLLVGRNLPLKAVRLSTWVSDAAEDIKPLCVSLYMHACITRGREVQAEGEAAPPADRPTDRPAPASVYTKISATKTTSRDVFPLKPCRLFAHFNHLSSPVKGNEGTPTVHTGAYYPPAFTQQASHLHRAACALRQ